MRSPWQRSIQQHVNIIIRSVNVRIRRNINVLLAMGVIVLITSTVNFLIRCNVIIRSSVLLLHRYRTVSAISDLPYRTAISANWPGTGIQPTRVPISSGNIIIGNTCLPCSCSAAGWSAPRRPHHRRHSPKYLFTNKGRWTDISQNMGWLVLNLIVYRESTFLTVTLYCCTYCYDGKLRQNICWNLSTEGLICTGGGGGVGGGW